MPFWQDLWIVLPFVIAIGAPALGLVIGVWIDREHRSSLDYRRRQVGHLLVTDLKSYPGLDRARGTGGGPATEVIVGEVTLGCNSFFVMIGRIKMLFGGEVRSFYSLLTRARQEAVMRVMEQAAERGFDAVCNVRLEAVDISGQTVSSGGRNNRPRVYIGIIAYGMAYHRGAGIYPPAAPPTLMDYLQ